MPREAGGAEEVEVEGGGGGGSSPPGILVVERVVGVINLSGVAEKPLFCHG